MKTELYYYDIYPKVVKSETPETITIKPISPHVAFTPNTEYTIEVWPLTHEQFVSAKPPVFSKNIKPIDGMLIFECAFIGEQEHSVRVKKDDKNLVSLAVYSLKEDLFKRQPYLGDFHVHTAYSDGRESPGIVAAMYRQAGYDFAAITDHHIYEPSVEAIKTYEHMDLPFKLYPGEEVHTPENNVHIIHFGGDYSINAISKVVTGPWESTVKPEWVKEVKAIESTLTNVPAGIDTYIHASCLLAFKKIREAGGMSIFCHPYWIANIYNVSDVVTKYYLENSFADAFELVAGQSSYENMMQVAMYQEVRSNGHKIAVVGNSDSHGTINQPLFNHMKTIVFAEKNERDSIINSVKNGYSVAVNDYQIDDVQMYSSYRMVSYALFLYNHFFPIQNELCFEEGRLMRAYVGGDPNAEARLISIKDQTINLRKKYFNAE